MKTVHDNVAPVLRKTGLKKKKEIGLLVVGDFIIILKTPPTK